MALDPNAMYRAGLAAGTTGRNPQVERQIARRERLVNFAYDVVGTVANEAIKDGFESMQRFRDLKDSQTAAMNLTAKKVPEDGIKGPNGLDLKGSIVRINNETRDLNKQIRFSFGPKRARLKAERQAKHEEMSYINSILTTQQAKTKDSQGMVTVATGIAGENNKGGNSNISPSASGEQVKNIAEQANGDLGQLMWYDHENKVMRVTRGGKWIEDKDGKRSYVNMGIEENKELKKKYKDYVKRMKSVTQDPSQQGATVSAGGTGDFSLGGNMPTHADAFGEQKTQEITGTKTMSYQDWAQTQNQKTLRSPKYSELKFARPEIRIMTNDHLGYKKDFRKLGYTGKSVDLELEKGETYNKIDAYSEPAFKDFFFGGPGFNHSNRTLTEGSLAYKMLISRNLDDDPDNDVVPPDSDNSTKESNLRWQGALTTLKMQDMRSGSQYRKFAQDEIWTEYEGEVTKSQARWKKDNPQTTKPMSISGGGESYINLWGSQILAPQTATERHDYATVRNIANDQPTVIVGNTKYERVNGAGYDYRAIEDKSGGIWKSIPPKQRTTTKKESLIQSVSPVYGGVPDGYFGESNYKTPKKTKVFNPADNQVTVAQMKDVLKSSGGPYNQNASDEQVRNMYKKYVKSLMPQNQ